MEQAMKQKFCEAMEHYKDYITSGAERLNMQLYADKLVYCYEHDMHMMDLYAWILYEETAKIHVTFEEYAKDTYRDLRESNEDTFREFVVDEAKIEALCAKLRMKYKLMPGMLYVQTAAASWKIIYNRVKIERIYHQNSNYSRTYSRKETDGYHIQDRKFSTIEEVLQYIYVHDRRFAGNR